MFIIILDYQIPNVKAETNLSRQEIRIIDVVLYDFRDSRTTQIKQNIENIQKQNEGKVRFNFYDSKGNQEIQNEIVSKLLTSNQNALLVSLVDSEAAQSITVQFKQREVPVIFLNEDSVEMESIKSSKKDYKVKTNENEENSLVNLWKNNRTAIDTNNNGILQYVMLRNSQDSAKAQEKMESIILTLEEAGIETAELAQGIANWNRELAKENVNILFLVYGSNIEVILTNSDEAAMGAIDALQEHGYNLGDPKKTIIVVGIDEMPGAKEIIKKDIMTDTDDK